MKAEARPLQGTADLGRIEDFHPCNSLGGNKGEAVGQKGVVEALFVEAAIRGGEGGDLFDVHGERAEMRGDGGDGVRGSSTRVIGAKALARGGPGLAAWAAE